MDWMDDMSETKTWAPSLSEYEPCVEKLKWKGNLLSTSMLVMVVRLTSPVGMVRMSAASWLVTWILIAEEKIDNL